jgi:hypothetical protein
MRRTIQNRERRLRHAETWDGITDEEILDRDGWRCQIPGCKRRPIRRDLRFPDPRSKSVDHIVPLKPADGSAGGDDTAVNKRAAHLGCNRARGNRMGAEQLPLFGSIREPPLVTMTAGERAVVRGPRQPRLCACGEETWGTKLCCRTCWDQRRAEIEGKRHWPNSRIRCYRCRYCGELKVARATGQRREVCPARACQLARLGANDLRLRNGMTAEEADARMVTLVASCRHDAA